MSGSKKVFIFGYSGHAYVLIDSMLDLGYEISGYFDYSESESNPYQIPYLGFERLVNLRQIVREGFVFPTVGDAGIRKKIIDLFFEFELNQFALVDPSARISKMASIGNSTYVGKYAVVNALAKIGSGVIINTSAIVEHECIVSDYAHLAPNATLAGNVKVGKGSFIGVGAVAKPGIEIGAYSVIGAGAVVVNNIPENETWVGVPAKKMK